MGRPTLQVVDREPGSALGSLGSLCIRCVWVCACVHASILGARAEGHYGLTLHVLCTILFSHRKWQEANQKIQELQASQEERADHEQKIKVGVSCQPVQLPELSRDRVSPPVTHRPS